LESSNLSSFQWAELNFFNSRSKFVLYATDKDRKTEHWQGQADRQKKETVLNHPATIAKENTPKVAICRLVPFFWRSEHAKDFYLCARLQRFQRVIDVNIA
jgi:hypothetical protein